MRAGDKVADFELPDETGTPRKLSEFLHDNAATRESFFRGARYVWPRLLRDLADEFDRAFVDIW